MTIILTLANTIMDDISLLSSEKFNLLSRDSHHNKVPKLIVNTHNMSGVGNYFAIAIEKLYIHFTIANGIIV